MGWRSKTKQSERLAVAAADWVARTESGNTVDQREFERWLRASPEHVKEFLLASSWKETLSSDLAASKVDVDELLASDNVIELTDRVAPADHGTTSSRRWPRIVRFGSAVAAAAALIVVMLSHLIWPASNYTTGVGEQRTIALSDGSLISLNTKSEVHVSYSSDERAVTLASGQAMFTVAHDPNRPFRVQIAGAVVQAIGTKFDIRRHQNSTSVAVVDGRIQVFPASADGGRNLVAAGQGVDIPDAGAITQPTAVDLAEVTAWQQRRLIFRNDTLHDIVSEFNRYNVVPIAIGDNELAARRYSGVWDADHPEVLFTYLKLVGDVEVSRSANQVLLRPGAQQAGKTSP